MPGAGAAAGTAWGLWLALGSMLTFACCVLLSAGASRRLDSDSGALLAAAVTLPVGLGIALLQFAGGRVLTAPTPLGLIAFSLAGIFSTYLGRWLFFKSVETIGPTRASVFQTCSPVVTALIGWLCLGERLGAIGWLGMSVAAAGLVVMGQVRPGSKKADSAGRRLEARAARGALVVGLGSTFAYAVSHIFRGAAVREWDEAVLGATLGAVAGVLVLLVVSGRQRTLVAAGNIRKQPLGALMYCGVGAMQFGAQVLMIASMKYIPVSVTALIACCTPLVVMPISMLLLKNTEQLKPLAIVGVLVTVAGVALVLV